MSDDHIWEYREDYIQELHPKYEGDPNAPIDRQECHKCGCSVRKSWNVCVPCYGEPKTCYRCNGRGTNHWGKCFRCDGTGKITVEKAIKNACYDHHAMMREARKMM